jgi:hypothetical protein
MPKLDLYEMCIPGDFGLNFKVPIWHDALILNEDDNKEIKAYCQNKILYEKNINANYVKNSWHKTNIFSEKLNFVEKIKIKIKESYEVFAENYGVSQKEIWINGWINLLTKGENLVEHCHSMNENSYLSGVIILSECDNTTTDFYLPQLEHIPEVGVLKIENKKGNIVMFPQWLYHSVSAVKQDVRITMGFDLFGKKSVDFFNSNKKKLKNEDWPIQRAIKLV